MNELLDEFEIAELRNFIRNDPNIALEILRECAEVAGLVSKTDYSHILGVPIRTVQHGCKSGKIKGLNISGDIIPCVNCNL